MGRTNVGRVALALLTALAMSATGCMGSGPSAGLSQPDLLLNEGLEEISAAEWVDAPAGCEGLLDGEDVEFRVADAIAGLVAAVDSEGEVLCVDTIGAVGEELAENGRDDDARSLVAAFLLSISEVRNAARGMSMSAPVREGDPDPQPNSRWSSDYHGDPDPQPN